MPEGHTIHRLARDQSKDFRGRIVSASSPQGRFVDGSSRIDGAALVRAEAWGKHLFHRYDTGELLHVHLGLIGVFRRHGPTAPVPDPVGAVRLRLQASGVAWDLSGPMICSVIGPEDRDRVVAKLGPDPLRPDADGSRFVHRAAVSPRAIGDLLLDQSVIAGIGNVYRAEVLFLTGVHPAIPGRMVGEERLHAIWDECVKQLRIGLRRNRIVTIDPAELGKPISGVRRGEGVWVYHQEHCRRCGAEIEREELGGRRIEACPVCQPAHHPP